MTTPPITAVASSRVRHAPTPRDPNLPLTMRVQVEVGFVQSCPDCRVIVAAMANSCINDASVTGFRALPGRRHAHDVADGTTALPGLSDATTATPAISDTNGAEPADVERVLWATQDGAPNGYDAP